MGEWDEVLEAQLLLEFGNVLEDPPSSVDELFLLLDVRQPLILIFLLFFSFETFDYAFFVLYIFCFNILF